MARQLNSQLPVEFQQAPSGAWQTFDVVTPVIAPGGPIASTVQFPVTAALFEIQGAAQDTADPPTAGSGTAELGFTDMFTIQFSTAGGEQFNAGAPVIGTAFFNRMTGIHMFRKPWIIPANQTINITGANIDDDDSIIVHLCFTVLLLELSTNAVQFTGG
jgi:hypothetical protein